MVTRYGKAVTAFGVASRQLRSARASADFKQRDPVFERGRLTMTLAGFVEHVPNDRLLDAKPPS